MTKAICCKCGTAKFSALVSCKSCNVAPRNNRDYTFCLTYAITCRRKINLRNTAKSYREARGFPNYARHMFKLWTR